MRPERYVEDKKRNTLSKNGVSDSFLWVNGPNQFNICPNFSTFTHALPDLSKSNNNSFKHLWLSCQIGDE